MIVPETGTRGDSFSSFNARAVPASVLVKSFIPPTQFATLTRRAHTVIVGPRGSGKTTLLKMLTPEALADPGASDALLAQPPVTFTGVFVPTDITWSAQLNSYRLLGLGDSQGADIVHACFTTAVLRAFVLSLHQRVAVQRQVALLGVLPLVLSPTLEVSLASSLADAWGLVLPIPSLLGLRSALSSRLLAISRFAKSESRLGSDGRNERFATCPHLDLPLIGSLSAGVDCFEAVFPEAVGERWALLFDELELAPGEIRAELLRSLPSVDERFLFKLSISPFGEDLEQLTSALSAMPGHDYDEVSLSYGRKEEGLKFSLELMTAISDRHRHGSKGLSFILGESDFPLDRDPQYCWSERGPASGTKIAEARRARYFRSLFDLDRTFREYVLKHAAGVEELLTLVGDARSQLVRKVTPIVIVRSAFRVSDDSLVSGSRRYKTRKNPDVYRGLTSLATVLEGNPRYIISVMNGLLDSGTGGKISGSRQTAEISRASNQFRALLTTIPTPAVGGMRRRGLLPLVDMVGDYFRARIVGDDFSPDPVGSFRVDSHAATELLNALGYLLNTGAIIHVPEPDGVAILTSLRGKRFRLSYLLASQFGLPLRLERDTALSNVMGRGGKKVLTSLQFEIFDEESR